MKSDKSSEVSVVNKLFYFILDCLTSVIQDRENNPGGIGQGSDGGPQGYHSHLIAKVKADESLTDQCIKFNNPDGSFGFLQWLVGFVDDNSILLSVTKKDFTKSMIDEILSECKKCIGLWQKLVVIAGGDLR